MDVEDDDSGACGALATTAAVVAGAAGPRGSSSTGDGALGNSITAGAVDAVAMACAARRGAGGLRRIQAAIAGRRPVVAAQAVATTSTAASAAAKTATRRPVR